MADMEEKVQYQSDERLRDVNEVLENCQTRVSVFLPQVIRIFYNAILNICISPDFQNGAHVSAAVRDRRGNRQLKRTGVSGETDQRSADRTAGCSVACRHSCWHYNAFLKDQVHCLIFFIWNRSFKIRYFVPTQSSCPNDRLLRFHRHLCDTAMAGCARDRFAHYAPPEGFADRQVVVAIAS